MWKICFSRDNSYGNKAQREELEIILKNFKDIKADNVLRLIYYSSEQYIVFLDSDLEVDFETTDEYDKQYPDRKEKIDDTYTRIEEMEHSPAVQYLSEKTKKAFTCLLGDALVAELNGSKETVTQTLQTAETYFKARTAEISRRWLLINAFGATLIGYAIWKLFLPKDFVLFGCLGALFSILCKTGKLEYDCQGGRFLNMLEILSRFLAAIISAYLAEQLYQIDLLFSAFKTIDDSSIVLSLICFVAGFSERLVPSIVSHLGSKEEKERTENDS